jgi:hypothetical protein
MRQIDRGYVMTDHEAFGNWLREHEGYAAAAENLSEAELYSCISRLPSISTKVPPALMAMRLNCEMIMVRVVDSPKVAVRIL